MTSKLDDNAFFKSMLGVLSESNLNIEVVDSLGDESTKLVLPWIVTTAFLSDNPVEGVTRFSELAGIQAANDIWELIFDGDTDTTDPLLSAMDGFHKLQADTDNYVVKIAKEEFTQSKDSEGTKYYLNLKVLLENVQIPESSGVE